MALIFHPLVQKDVSAVLSYYESKGGLPLADRFFAELSKLVAEIEDQPQKFHPAPSGLRRANLTRFPYHFLYRASASDIRIFVLRHHKRHPSFGMARR